MLPVTIYYLLLATVFLPVLAAKSNPYCSKKQFAITNANCGKFQFNNLKNMGHCTDSKKKTQGKFQGIKLSNCTTQVSLT